MKTVQTCCVDSDTKMLLVGPTMTSVVYTPALNHRRRVGILRSLRNVLTCWINSDCNNLDWPHRNKVGGAEQSPPEAQSFEANLT